MSGNLDDELERAVLSTSCGVIGWNVENQTRSI
jgi:hypothetical protein